MEHYINFLAGFELGLIVILLFYIGYYKVNLKYERDEKIILQKKHLDNLHKMRMDNTKMLDQCDRIISSRVEEIEKEKGKNKFLSEQNIYLHSLLSEENQQKYFDKSEYSFSARSKKNYNDFIDSLQFTKGE